MAENGPTIGKAYVQIIPTTKGIKKAMEAEITGSASGAAEKEGAASGSGFAGAFAKALAAGTAAISAAAIKIGKEALSAYADYEQLVGGVETLFGTGGASLEAYAAQMGKDTAAVADEWNALHAAQEAVLKSAETAYKSAGLSANEYIETVTGFSASLIASVGGDTVAAAALADQAIVDMSDNANKMGSSMESIQNAYSGFAKQNYTMLDNLKLGYGGTKEEMQRLLEDAQAISGIEYDISSYADVVNAIHVIQTEMGITGTTAKEAEATISGSLGMLQASFQNLVAGMGNADADMTTLVGNVINSGNAFLTNIQPIIENVVAALPQAITGMLEAAAPMLPTVLEAGVGIFQAVLDGLIQMLPDFIPVALALLSTLINTIIENLPLLVNAAVQLITSLAQDIGTSLPILIPTIVDIMLQIVKTLTEPAQLDMLINTALTLISGLAEGLLAALPRLVKALPEIIKSISKGLVEHMPEILKLGMEIVVQLIGGIVKSIPELLLCVLELAGLAISALIEGFKTVGDIGKNLISGLWDGIKSKTDWIKQKISGFCDGILDGIKGFFGIKSPSRVMADIVGTNLALGIGEGFSDEMTGVSRDMAGNMNGLLRDVTAAGNASLNASITHSYETSGTERDEGAELLAAIYAIGNRITEAINSKNLSMDGQTVASIITRQQDMRARAMGR